MSFSLSESRSARAIPPMLPGWPGTSTGSAASRFGRAGFRGDGIAATTHEASLTHVLEHRAAARKPTGIRHRVEWDGDEGIAQQRGAIGLTSGSDCLCQKKLAPMRALCGRRAGSAFAQRARGFAGDGLACLRWRPVAGILGSTATLTLQ
jgi:hypothetical protein